MVAIRCQCFCCILYFCSLVLFLSLSFRFVLFLLSLWFFSCPFAALWLFGFYCQCYLCCPSASLASVTSVIPRAILPYILQRKSWGELAICGRKNNNTDTFFLMSRTSNDIQITLQMTTNMTAMQMSSNQPTHLSEKKTNSCSSSTPGKSWQVISPPSKNPFDVQIIGRVYVAEK